MKIRERYNVETLKIDYFCVVVEAVRFTGQVLKTIYH